MLLFKNNGNAYFTQYKLCKFSVIGSMLPYKILNIAHKNEIKVK